MLMAEALIHGGGDMTWTSGERGMFVVYGILERASPGFGKYEWFCGWEAWHWEHGMGHEALHTANEMGYGLLVCDFAFFGRIVRTLSV